jgi:hypothetical protein
MAFNASSYFAGVATVVGTMALGFGGGIMMTHAMIGGREAATNHLERRIADNNAAPAKVVVPSPYRDDINARANAVTPAESAGALTPAEPNSPSVATEDKTVAAGSPVATSGNGRPIVANSATTSAVAADNSSVGAVKADTTAQMHDGSAKRVASDGQRADRQRRQIAARIKQQRDNDELAAAAETVRQIEPEPARDIVVQSSPVQSSPFGLFN